MAKLTAPQRQALARQLSIRLQLERSLSLELRRTFRKYVGVVTEFAREVGLLYLPPSLSEEVREILLRHYKRCARRFIDFTRSVGGEKFAKVPIDTKVWSYALELKAVPDDYMDNIDRRIRIRLEEEFNRVATQRAASIADVTASEINEYIDSLNRVATAQGYVIPYSQMASLIRDFYNKRSQARSKAISITETTMAVEKTKEIEIEELIDELDDEDLLELAESNPEYEEIITLLTEELAGLSGDDPIATEDLIAAGGILALAASVTVTKTWVAVLDESTREAHAEADGQEVPIDESFEVDGEDIAFPGDPSGSPGNVINCRCAVLYGL